jgi:DNA-directed RNA polymerase subunit RPC12/RpoP
MEPMTLEDRLGGYIQLDACTACRAFWFDKYEDLQLSPGATLKLFQRIGEAPTTRKAPIPEALRCPRCGSRLLATHDMQRNTRFGYWRCDRGHGRFITFFDFLREKDFIRPLSPQQIAELRESVQVLSCSNCGAPIDLGRASACAHCGAPISMLDMKQAGRVVSQLRDAAAPKPVDPSLPLELERARREVDAALAGAAGGPGSQDWWRRASSTGLVEAGLGLVARLLKKSG